MRDHGELVVAHPTCVAQADQLQAAEPRRTPSEIVLRGWIPPDAVYVVNLDRFHELVYGESPWRTLRRTRYANVGVVDPLDSP